MAFVYPVYLMGHQFGTISAFGLAGLLNSLKLMARAG